MEGSGSLPDGAFERFVTSALAAIITIVFSWRLLAEGQEQLEGANRPRLPRFHELDHEKKRENDEQPPVDIPIDENIQRTESETQASVPKYATLESNSETKQDEVDSSPSWGDYSWEEDMYDTVHTRRHVQDFAVKRSPECSDGQEMESDIQLSPIPASHEMLEKLYMNQEYRSIVDDGEQSDSSDSDDDESVEGVYETEIVEQDMDMYYASGLEPIIEEDSDDMDSSEGENEEHSDFKNQDVGEHENSTYQMTSDNEPGATRQDLVVHEKVKHQTDMNASLNDSDDTSSLPDLADDNKSLLDNFIEECFDKCNDDSDSSSEKSDSLPPSPIIRTRAIDDDNENLSDESCSSESVVTVLSVKSDYGDTPEIQIVEDSNRPLSFIFNDNESNTPDNLKERDILAFIHGSQERIDLNKTPDNDIDDEIVIDDIINPLNENQLDYEEFIKDIQAASEINTDAENSQNKEKSNNISEKQNGENDTLIDQKGVENELFILESTDCLNVNAPTEHSNQKINNISFNELSKVSENIDNRFDDDVGPREYNPYDDDFAEFGYCDSDDDSFYLVVGESNHIPNFSTFNSADSGHLRNFDTFDNLNAVGLSPAHDSSCESGMSDDGRFIFSRTENISTEYRSRFYVKDREAVVSSNNTEICKTENVIKPEIDLQVENKNSYNESKLKNVESSDPVISDLENIELFIDESKISENFSPPSKVIDSENQGIEQSDKLTNIDKAINYSPQNEQQNNAIKDVSISETTPLIVEKTDINDNNADDELLHSTKDEKVSITTDNSEKLMNYVKCNNLQTNTPLQNSDESAKSNIETSQPNVLENGQLETSLKPCIEILSRAHDSGIDLDAESSKLDSSDDSAPSPVHKYELLDILHAVKGQIDRTSVVKPSLLNSNTKTKVQQQKQKQRSKSYVSVLQQPMTPDTTRSVAVVLPDKPLPMSRQQIIASRKRFLSEQNLLSDGMQDKFQQHKTSFEQTTRRKPRYVRRGNSLPKSRNYKSYEKIDSNSLNSSRSSVEKPEICTLHDNCIFSPNKHQEILDRTLSIENLESTLMRYGSVASLVETDIDSGETTEYQIFTDFDNDFQFQLPLERTASMSELASRKKNKTETKGRFSDRNVPKSKSLCTLETNIDDIDEAPRPGTLGRVPSVHELRVTKSLQKLNVPDWYKKSSVSRSGSTWSLYSSPRKDSISSYNYSPSITSSPCPSVSVASNSVVIRTRITPSSARLFRSPKLQTTPEKSPTPISVQLPSEKLRQKEKPKELMPIPIVPFTKLRLMFEENSRKLKPISLSSQPPSSSPVATPTTPVSPTEQIAHIQAKLEEKPTTKPVVPAKPILKKTTASVSENKNVGRVEPQQVTPLSVQPMSTSPRSGRRVETTFNGSVGQTEVRKAKETTFDGEKPVQVVKPEKQEQKISPQISKTTENQNEHNSKSARYSSLSKSLKSAFRRPQKSATVEQGGSKIETIV